MDNIKERIKYILRRYFGYDIRSIRTKLEEDFLDQKKFLEYSDVKIIFDVGANVGQTTGKYKKLFPKAEIYGFEPFKEVFDIYTKNFRGDKRVHGINLALSNENGERKFFINNNNYTNSLLPINKDETVGMSQFKTIKEVNVPTQTIDSFCETNNIQHIDILKMDVQGGELFVLEGAKDMLAKKAIDLIYTEIEFVALYENQPLFNDMKNFFEKSGYVFYKNYNVEYNAKNEPQITDTIFLNPTIFSKIKTI